MVEDEDGEADTLVDYVLSIHMYITNNIINIFPIWLDNSITVTIVDLTEVPTPNRDPDLDKDLEVGDVVRVVAKVEVEVDLGPEDIIRNLDHLPVRVQGRDQDLSVRSRTTILRNLDPKVLENLDPTENRNRRVEANLVVIPKIVLKNEHVDHIQKSK